MATRRTATKSAAAKDAKVETKATATAVKETAPVKETPVKKTAPKKVAPKAEAPAEVKTETKVNFVVEFNNKQNSVEDIINNVKATYGKDVKEISIYLKPDENKAYFVADGEESSMDVFFC